MPDTNRILDCWSFICCWWCRVRVWITCSVLLRDMYSNLCQTTWNFPTLIHAISKTKKISTEHVISSPRGFLWPSRWSAPSSSDQSHNKCSKTRCNNECIEAGQHSSLTKLLMTSKKTTYSISQKHKATQHIVAETWKLNTTNKNTCKKLSMFKFQNCR